MNLISDYCLKPHNTFGIDTKAKYCLKLNDINDLNDCFKDGYFKNKILCIGEGSNLLFTKNFDGLVILVEKRGIEIIETTGNKVIVKANAGEYWTTLVDFCVENNLWGIENLSMIPGKCGAAPVQNIGAYGTEIKDVFVSLEAFDTKSGEIRTFTKDECKFDYRNSIFKTQFPDRFIILNISLRLDKNGNANLKYKALAEYFNNKKPGIVEVRDAVNSIRSSKLPDPQTIKNAGSFFKNPVIAKARTEELKIQYPDMPLYRVSKTHSKVAAGWLIEKAGWKGKSIGDAGVHDKQALVLVNYGNAKGEKIAELADNIKSDILNKFDIELEAEVRII